MMGQSYSLPAFLLPKPIVADAQRGAVLAYCSNCLHGDSVFDMSGDTKRKLYVSTAQHV